MIRMTGNGLMMSRGKALREIPLLGILIPLLGMYGCTTTVVGSDVPCPARPVLSSFNAVELGIMAASTQEKIASNQIKLKAYARKLEVRASCDVSTD